MDEKLFKTLQIITQWLINLYQIFMAIQIPSLIQRKKYK